MSAPVSKGGLEQQGVTVNELWALGLRTRVLEAGPSASEEAVVFLHGGPGSAEDWAHQLPRVGEFARALAFDLPGLGQADKPRHFPYSGPGWATFVQAALNELGVSRVHLVMNDLGGDAGIHWAAAHPSTFASAVLVNTGPLIGYRWHAIARLHRAPVLGATAVFGGRLGLRTVMRLYEPRLPREVVKRWQRGYGLASRRALDRFYANNPAVVTSDLVPDFNRLDRPALVIWGKRNRFVPVKHASDQLESFPSAELVLLPDCGHYAQLEAPERVSELLVSFLRKQLTPQATSDEVIA
jgi:pimeloyl-ACP methyl ester carboxylesterase